MFAKSTYTRPLIPSQFAPFIYSCRKCPKPCEKTIINESLAFKPYMMVVTEHILDSSEKDYLKKILSSIHLDFNSQSDVYLTTLVKCNGLEGDKDAQINCFSNLKEEIKLVSPFSILCFGKCFDEVFTFFGYNTDVFERSIPFIISPLPPLVLKDSIEERKKLWDKLLTLKSYFLTL